jgi:decaprenyl-phosphate phosphoribosyltransferase
MFHSDVLGQTILAFAAFSLVASGVYLVNDLLDIEDDRRHPTKRFRAIASGDLRPGVARILAIVLFAVGFLLPLDLPQPEGFYIVLVLYVVESLAYSLKVKTVAVLELGFVASGFFLRSYAGAVASHIPVSQWFLVVVTFGALFLVIGKRSAELRHVGTANRVVLRDYSPEFLHSALTMAAGVVVTTYCLWAFDTSSTGLSSVKHDVLWIRITVVPVVLAVLYIVRGAESPAGESPEDLLLKNRVVQGLALVWLFFLAWGTYL